MYTAIVARIQKTEPISGADRILKATVNGNTVVVGIDTKEGDMGIYFECDGKLSKEFLEANNLIRYKDPVTGEYKGGFFEEKGRVRAQAFKGVKSNGFWCPLSYLDFTLGWMEQKNPEELPEGFQFDTFNGIKICEKYYTPKTMAQLGEKRIKIRKGIPTFPKHTDTQQYRHCRQEINGGIIIITEKVHGTSQRTGNVYIEEDSEDFKTSVGWKRFLPWIKPKKGYQIVNGTRNVVLRDESHSTWYKEGEKFRWNVIRDWKNKLHKNEVVYFEVVGFTENKQPIMPAHETKNVKDKAFNKQYGNIMNYTYGCNSESDKLNDVYVYRITMCNEDGIQVDYSWQQVKARCQELGINHVPEIIPPFIFTTIEDLDKLVEDNMPGESTIDSTHIREGVCIRVEDSFTGPRIFKAKSWEFGLMEGYLKDNEDFVDLEEVS